MGATSRWSMSSSSRFSIGDPPKLSRTAPDICLAPLALRPTAPANARMRRPGGGILPRSRSMALPCVCSKNVPCFATVHKARLRGRAPDRSFRRTASIATTSVSPAPQKKFTTSQSTTQLDEFCSDVSDEQPTSVRPSLAECARYVSRSVKRRVGRVSFSRVQRRTDRAARR